jgi:glycosyltransferase involved in cell wall biosynthesis
MISVVIPSYNEEESLGRLYAEIAQVAAQADLDVEILFIDDGSRDGSWDLVAQLMQRDARVKGIRLRRNFGKAAALSTGFRAARGGIIITLDADLQDDPAEIPSFLRELKGGLSVVSGWKRVRHDPWHKVWASRLFNRLVCWITGVRLHDHNCGMKAYRAEVLREIQLYGERHRFIPVLAAARGFRVGEMEIRHRARRFGRSKYGISRFAKGFLDLLTITFLTRFGQRPQHVLGGFGLAVILAGFFGFFYLTLTWFARLVDPEAFLPLSDRPLLIYSATAMLLGTQMLAIGILAEMLTESRRNDDTYSIAEPSRAARPKPWLGPDRRRGERRLSDQPVLPPGTYFDRARRLDEDLQDNVDI